VEDEPAALIVDGELRQLRKIEAMAEVKSVNLLVPDMWSRLWANAFLLRKEQFFPTHTYEGRLNTPLRGEWDLEGGLIAIELPDGARRQVTRRFALVDTRHPAFVRAEFADGWHPEKAIPAPVSAGAGARARRSSISTIRTTIRWQFAAGSTAGVRASGRSPSCKRVARRVQSCGWATNARRRCSRCSVCRRGNPRSSSERMNRPFMRPGIRGHWEYPFFAFRSRRRDEG
jgi:hypothetical protein